jgi:hypothetical protein
MIMETSGTDGNLLTHVGGQLNHAYRLLYFHLEALLLLCDNSRSNALG